jgi:hypothetical protein
MVGKRLRARENKTMGSNRPTLILGGQARLPKELSTGTVLQIVVELDVERNRVLDVNCSPCIPLIEEFLKQSMSGMNLEQDMETLLEAIEKRLVHRSKKAVGTAVKDLVREYREYKHGPAPGQERRHSDYPED